MINDLRVMQKAVDMAVGIEKFSYQQNRNQPKPKGEFCSIKLAETKKVGYPKIEYINSPLGITYRTSTTTLLIFNILFSRDHTEIDEFNNSYSRPDIREFLWKQGYALMSATPLYNKDRKFETDWEERAGVSVTVSTIRVYESLVSEIDTIEVNGDLYEGSHKYEMETVKVGDTD